MLDHILHLMAHTDTYREWSVDQVTRCIVPPVNLKQCLGIIENGYLVAWISWGYLSQEKADIFLEGNYKLMPEDWSSGDVLVFMDCVAPFGHVRQIVRMCRNLFPKYPKAEWRRHLKQKRVGVDLRISS